MTVYSCDTLFIFVICEIKHKRMNKRCLIDVKHVIKNNQYSYQYIKQNKDYEIKKKGTRIINFTL